MPYLNITSRAPGVQVFDNSAGSVNIIPGRFGVVYVLGSSATGPKNIPVQVVSTADFTAQFGASPTTRYIRQFFDAMPTGILYFISATNAVVNKPTLTEYQAAVTAAVDDRSEPGFLIAPNIGEDAAGAATGALISGEVFTLQTFMAQRAELFNWHVKASCSNPGLVNTPPAASAALAYTAPKGHISVYWPWCYDPSFPTDITRAYSPVMGSVIVNLTRYKEVGGFATPGASEKIPVPGVGLPTYELRQAEIDTLTGVGVNTVVSDVRRYRGSGALALINGYRTRNLTDLTVTFENQAIVRNVIATDLTSILKNYVFDIVDGRGSLFFNLESSITSYLSSLYAAGAIFGNRPEEAFNVTCSFQNNLPANLQQGIVIVSVWYVGPVGAERIALELVRTQIGQVQIVRNQQLGV
jgi:hypothetical protein